MNNVFLIENHDEALKVWREKKIKGRDLVHIDAHIDFGFQQARPIEQVIREARNLKELKRNLEYSLAFMHYEDDFDKQTNIGNYVYPAMEEERVKNFYWVVPGGLKEFKAALKNIKIILKGFMRQSGSTLHAPHSTLKDGIISTNLFGRKFIICILEKLHILKQKVLLDIDTDFLVIDNLINAGNMKNIGKRKPWIIPQELIEILKKKIIHPRIITIAYSVNGGYTPIIYKHLADEMAFLCAPGEFKRRFENNYKAGRYFNLFASTGKREYYQRAVRLNPTYRVLDNNYGPLYFSLRRFSSAQKEFLKVLRADPKNPACLLGLGNIALERKDFKKARKYFLSVLHTRNHKLFAKVKNQSLWGLARAEFNLKNFKKAKELFFRYQTFQPLQSQSYYFLGRIFEKERDFSRAVEFYKDAIRLSFGDDDDIEPISRLLKISFYLEEKDDIIKYAKIRYREFKKGFMRMRRRNLKKGKSIKGLHRIEKRMLSLEKRLQRYVQY